LIIFTLALATLASLEITDLFPELHFLPIKIVVVLSTPLFVLAILSKGLFYPLLIMCVAVFMVNLICFTVVDIKWLKNSAVGMVFCLFYCGLLPSFIPLIYEYNPDGNKWLVSLFFIIWSYDTAAYFGGKATGKARLAPSISPGKTVEGLFWGFAGTIPMAVVLGLTLLSGQSMVLIISASIIISAAGIAGDLLESALKRSAGVKDSSSLIPGHGGILDRFDSILFAAPALYIILLLRDLII
jgi:phosphatidate cytidylyltransferase